MAPFPITLSDPLTKFQGLSVTIDALGVLCAQLTRDLFAIAKFLVSIQPGRAGHLVAGSTAIRSGGVSGLFIMSWFQLCAIHSKLASSLIAGCCRNASFTA